MHVPPGIDSTVPHSARMWNYWLGGKDNFTVDATVAQDMQQRWPDLVAVAPQSRAFQGRVVRHLVTEAGVRQFLDLGSGLPQPSPGSNTHEIAQECAPECRVVYVDIDPLVLVHSQALLTSTREGATDYVEADLCDAATVLDHAARTLDLDQPVGLLIMSTLGHVPAKIAAELVPTYTSRLAPGSYLAVCDTLGTDEVTEANTRYAASGTTPYTARTMQEIWTTARGTEILPPGIVPITHWPHPDEPPIASLQHGYLARKP